MANVDFGKIFTYVQGLRLDIDKSIISRKLDKNKKEISDGGKWDKFKTGFHNFRKTVITSAGNYENKNSTINNELYKYQTKNGETITKDEAKDFLFKLNQIQDNKLSKLMFNINIALDNEYEYTYMNDGLKQASKLINNDEYIIIELKSEIEKYYKIITNKNLDSLQKRSLSGICLASLATLALFKSSNPNADMNSSSYQLTTLGFVNQKVGLGILTLTGALLGAASNNKFYLASRKNNEDNVNKEFRKLNAEEFGLHLAIQAAVIRHLKHELGEDQFKTRLNSTLHEINSLKMDLDYCLFVDRREVYKNKEKISIFYGFDKVLTHILDV